MRQLSRLLSVFIALILMGLSMATASADATTDADGESYATMSVVMVDPPDAIYPGDELTFMITVYRLGDHSITSATVVGPDGTADSSDDVAAFAIYAEDTVVDAGTIATSTFHEAEVTYEVPGLDTGVSSRTLTLEWTLAFTADHFVANNADDEHEIAAADSEVTASDAILIETRPAAEGGATGVVLDFADPVVPEIEKGNEIEFSLTVSTADYRYRGGSFLIMKQVKDADGEDDGVALPVAAMQIDDLKTNSTSSAIEADYTLSQADVDALDEGGSIEFSYELDINEADITKNDAAVLDTGALPQEERTDFNKDDDTLDTIETSEGILLTLPVAAPEPEATPEPPVGMTEAATVTKGAGNLVDVERHDGGTNFSLGVGVLAADGTLEPHSNGYIRDSNLGQTYAVVARESDGAIVRVWISSASPHVGDIDWVAVLDFYNVPKDVVNAIPLDHTAPAPNQLVDAGGTWYAYTGGAWRHIPNIPTFQSRGYFYCDLTTAAEGWADNIQLGQALPSSGDTEDPDYPVCHS